MEIRQGDYGKKVLAVEPGGVEAIAEKDRHGRPGHLFATWMSPNLEFATIYVGALGVFFGLNFVQAVIGILLGNGLGALAHYFLTKDGPRYGVPQMVLGRAAFGRFGNILPSASNAFAAGIGWFAVNSVSGAFALATLSHWSVTTSLLLVVIVQISVAFLGHNLVQKVERYLMPYLVLVFGWAAIVIFSKSHLSTPTHWFFPGAFLVFTGAVYGYAAGWNPFAADFARYLPTKTNGKSAGLMASFGLFTSAAVLELVGAAAVSAGMHPYGATTNPVGDFTSFLPTSLGKLVLFGIVLGSICANALNIYSGSMSFLAMGVKLPTNILRALTALVFGVAGYFVAHWAAGNPANNLENFLLVMSYWIGPWLGVIFADKYLRRGKDIKPLLFAKRENWAGPVAFLVGAVLSIWLFANQSYYVGVVPKHNGNFGDIAFPIGFAISFILYTLLGQTKVKSE
jgi:NCS1 nucleoside transporter family